MEWSKADIPPNCLDTGSYPVRNVTMFISDSHVDGALFMATTFSTVNLIALPVVVGIGITGCVFVVLLLQHPDLRGFGTLILQANLVADALYMGTLYLITMPIFSVHTLYQDDKFEEFWQEIDNMQDSYVFGFPICKQTLTLSAWYTSALVIEQYAAYLKPEKLAQWSAGDFKIKVVITLLNASILIHIVLFFKFIRQGNCIAQFPTNSSYVGEPIGVYEADYVCLSTTYRDAAYIIYEKYAYFLIFQLLPWFVTLICLVKCYGCYKMHNRQIKSMRSINPSLLRLFRSGRSVDTTFVIALFYLIIYCIAHLFYMINMPYMQVHELDILCHITPTDPLLDPIKDKYGPLLFYCHLVCSFFKPFICLWRHTGIHYLIRKFFKRTHKCFHFYGRKLCLIVDCTRPNPPAEPIPSTEQEQEQGGAAPYPNGVLHAYDNPAVHHGDDDISVVQGRK